jgi:hypothetical protein
VLTAWIVPGRKKPRTLHHRGHGVFMVAGDSIRLRPRTGGSAAFLLALGAFAFGGSVSAEPASATSDGVDRWSEQFVEELNRRLDVPLADQQRYITLLQQALALPETPTSEARAFVLVDRSPQIQAAFAIMRTAAGAWHWTGASPISTGKVGTFDHFVTPPGVFAHTLDNPDFRAEGSFNDNHIRDHGLRGRRVFDFGWAVATRGWGPGGTSQTRLQMHATDPSALEPKLGHVESKGCIRIPSTLNVFLDRHGILDADYEKAQAEGKPLWVLDPERQPISAPGRRLVVIDSLTIERPAWFPLPDAKPSPEINPAASPASSALPFSAEGKTVAGNTPSC